MPIYIIDGVKMKNRTYSSLLLVLLATGCSLMPQPTLHLKQEQPTYDPAVSARVRFLSGNGTADADFWPQKACYRTPGLRIDPDVVHVNTESGWSYSATSTTIGMPQSPREYMRFEGLTFKDFIKEQVVAGNKPITVKLIAFGHNSSCKPPAVTFTPAAGVDYDIFMAWQAGRCRVAIQRIDASGLDDPILPTLAKECEPIGPAG